MDNAKIHRAKILRKIFISIKIVYNATHLPMLNPIEFVFGVYKMNKLFEIYKKYKNLVFLNKKYVCENLINQN